MSALITTDLVALDVDHAATGGEDKTAVVRLLAGLVARAGRATSADGLYSDAMDREAKVATGLPGGIAIPHCRSEAVTEASLAFARLRPAVDFGAQDGPADLVFLIAAPAHGDADHLTLLTALARDPTRWRRRAALVGLGLAVVGLGLYGALSLGEHQQRAALAQEQGRAAAATEELRRTEAARATESRRSEARALATTFADELIDADALLFAVPLYNYGVSQHFKTWFDLAYTDSRIDPTGTALPLATITALCAAVAAVGGVVVVDEAYGEFRRAGTPSALEVLPQTPNLVVSRTMSKAFALAGARLGYLAASTEITDAIRVVRLPYHLSAVTQAVARVALAHADEMLIAVDALRAERDELAAWLTRAGLEVAESDANFVLFGRFSDRHRIWQGLLDRGVLIRETGPDGWLRVSAGTPAEMAAFRTALTDVLGLTEKETR